VAEIRAAAYPGGYSKLEAFVPQLRLALTPEPVVRFETQADEQAQVDFARFTFLWAFGRRILRVRLQMRYRTADGARAQPHWLETADRRVSETMNRSTYAGTNSPTSPTDE
jgi:hypothetical protein